MPDNLRPWKLLGPPPDKCPQCATDHEPTSPHNASSLYYQYAFYDAFGRFPTWADAIAHCDKATRDAWESELRRRDKWTEPPDGAQPQVLGDD